MDFNMYNEIDYFNNFSEESNNSLDLFSPYEGYIKGNLFKNNNIKIIDPKSFIQNLLNST